MAKLSDTQKKHWTFFTLMILGAVGVFIGVFFLIWSDMSDEEKQIGIKLLDRVIIYSILALVVGFFISSQFILYIFKNYISPIENLTEETQLISVANSKYRIQPKGARETHKLTGVINELADSYLSLKMDVRSIIEQSKDEQDEEKRRLEALMSQIPQGVLVCNFDGRILMYNQKAHEILEEFEEKENNEDTGLLGLGRSIFGLLYRPPIIHALNYLQNRLTEEVSHPLFHFITTRFGKQFLHIDIAPILGLEGDTADITGYVLTIADITSEIEKKSQRDIFLQKLTLTLQGELGKIQDYSKELRNNLKGANNQTDGLDSIDTSVSNLLNSIDHVAVQHKNRLKLPETSEHVLGNELLKMIKEDIRVQFNLRTSEKYSDEIWLNISSYSVIRGVMYLLGQLIQNIEIKTVHLELEKENDETFIVIRWSGGEVEMELVDSWKQCPLMSNTKDKSSYSLESMVIPGSTIMELDKNKKVNRVKFKVVQADTEYEAEIVSNKNSRPVFYDLELFNKEIQSTDLDKVKLRELTCVVFDTETTGLDPSGGDEIISIGAVRIIDGKLHSEETYDQLVNPKRNIPLVSLKIHEIYPEMLADKPTIETVLPQFYRFTKGSVLIAHNAAFDMKFIQMKEEKTGIRFVNPVLDTLLLSSVCHPNADLHNLEDVAYRLGVNIIGRHTALGDSIVTAEVFLKLIPILEAKGIYTLREALEACSKTSFANLKF